MDTPETLDVVVVGGGLAGLVTAARAAQLGLRVLMLEQGTDDYPCNSRYSGGILHVAYRDVTARPEDLAEALRDAMGADADPDLIDDIAGRASQALDWLVATGIRFVSASSVPWHRWTLAPPRPLRPGFDFPGTGPDRLLGILEGLLTDNGGALLRGHKVTAVGRDGAAFEIRATTDAGSRCFHAGSVVFADGGFQGSREHVARFINARPDRLVQRGAGTGRGAAVDLAGALGCGLTRMDRFYGHLLSRDALHDPALSPYPQLDPIAAAGIVVDRSGRRFADERRGGVFLANEIARLEDPAGAVAVFDARIWDEEGRQSLYPANPHVETAGGTVWRAGTVRDLAALAGIDPVALEEAVDAFNRSGTRRLQTPFMALPLAVGITNTMGGVRVDASARALTEQGDILPGVYAVGASAGGLEGGSRVGYAGGLMRALTSGLAAAGSMAAIAGRTQVSTAPAYRSSGPPSRRSSYPVLRLLARHGPSAAASCAVILAAAAAILLWPVTGTGEALVCLVAGAVGGLVAKAFAEIAAIVLELLVP